MVGRMQDNKLAAQATGTQRHVAAHSRARERRGRIRSERCSADPYQPTDVAASTRPGVPTPVFTTGAHPTTTSRRDTADKINYEDLDRIVDFAAAIVQAVADHRMPPAVHQGRTVAADRRNACRRARDHRHDS